MTVTSIDLADLLDTAGLTGRGGAAFGTGTKLRSARSSGAAVIVNACDGEPGALKDQWVVGRHLDELVTGAGLLAEGRSIRYAAHRGSRTLDRLRSHALDTLEVPDRYVSSEESSLVSLAAGGLARPLTKRGPISLGGRDSAGRPIQPTLVVNAETTWRVAQVVEQGPAWFRSLGTPDEPGPRLVTVHGHTPQPGVLETAAGVPLRDLVAAAGGSPYSPVLVGGLAGTFLTPADVDEVRWETRSLAPFGGRTGSGVIEVLDPRACPLQLVLTRVRDAAEQSAGQCGPCMFGLPALAEDLAVVSDSPTLVHLERLHARLGMLPGRGACHFPDGVVGMTRSALRAFGDHLVVHSAGRCWS